MTVGYGNHEPPRTETPATSPAGAKPAPAPTAKEGTTPGKDDTATPGTGALATDPQGDEVDPGAG